VTGSGKFNSRMCQVISISGFGSRRTELLNIASAKFTIGKVSIEEEKVNVD
jgi:hypothetical protein